MAYLRADCSLRVVYRVRCMPGEDPLLAVASDVASSRRPFERVLIGRAAELLHVAVTGRIGDCSPEDAGVWVARRARELLAQGLETPGFAEAYAAVADFGDFIRPFYGVTLFDEDGRIVLDDARLGTEIDLPMVVGERLVSSERDGWLFGRN